MQNKETLNSLWGDIQEKKISYRSEGERYIVTITDNAPINYNANGNICVFFVNRACISLYELLRRYDGDIDKIENLLLSAGVPIQEIYRKLEDTLRILNGDMTHISIDDTELSHPYFAHIDITSVCNMACVHCLNPSENYQNDDMDTQKWLDAIDQFSRLGISVLWIGGGEPLLRKDLPLILSHAKSHQMRIVLASNGVMLDQDQAEQLAPLIDELTICLDGSTAEIHGYLRKPQNMFDVITHNIRTAVPLMHQHQCLVKIFTCVARHNLDDIPNIIDLSSQLGADSWACQTFVPMNRGANFLDQVLTCEMREKLAVYIENKVKEYKGRMCVQYYVPLMTMKKMYSHPKMECAAGNAILYVSSNGDVYPCSRLIFPPFLVGKIWDLDLEKSWISHPVFKQFRNISYAGTACASCEYFQQGMCNGGCKAEKYRAYASLFDKPDPSCGFAPHG